MSHVHTHLDFSMHDRYWLTQSESVHPIHKKNYTTLCISPSIYTSSAIVEKRRKDPSFAIIVTIFVVEKSQNFTRRGFFLRRLG